MASIRKRFPHLAFIITLVILLGILYIGFKPVKEKTFPALFKLRKTSREKLKSKLHFIPEVTENPICKNRWANYTVYDFDQPLHPTFHCIPFYSLTGYIPICIPDQSYTPIVHSMRSMDQRAPTVMEDFEQVLMNNADFDLIDIGAGIGMYSLLAANLKRLVFAVEPMKVNYRIFHQTVILNRLETLITLVTGSPILDNHKKVHLTVLKNGSKSWTLYSLKEQTKFPNYDIMQSMFLESITLDDLVSDVSFDKAIMIINLDGKEAASIRGGRKFFECIDIVYVFLDWQNSSFNERKYIVDFFYARNYTAHASSTDTKALAFDSYHIWPNNIVWEKAKPSKDTL